MTDKNIQMAIWDTAGQEEYERLRSLMYPGTNVFLIVFDVTQTSSFENAISKWFDDIKIYEKKSINIFVGNKIDKRDPDNPQHITTEQGQNTVKTLGKHNYYAECCAITGEGVDNVFSMAVDLELKRRTKRSCRLF